MSYPCRKFKKEKIAFSSKWAESFSKYKVKPFYACDYFVVFNKSDLSVHLASIFIFKHFQSLPDLEDRLSSEIQWARVRSECMKI